MFQLRPYQRTAVDATLDHFRASREPAVIVLPTGAGKSLVIAELARIARGRVLVLAHVKELVEQNHAKFDALDLSGSQCTGGIFAAGLGRKESTNKVVFGSVQSVARNLDKFDQEFSLLVIDECHRIPDVEDSQYQQVIKALRQRNQKLCILGLTATPYRLDQGWIYQFHHQGRIGSSEPRFFNRCVFELPIRHLLDQGFLTPPRLVDAPIAQYDFSQLAVQGNGLFSERDLNQSLAGQQRATKTIITQVIEASRERQGVMIFASTVRHAEEIMGYLPPGSAALITGETTPKARDNLIRRFKNRELKFLVNISVLTTGFDAPHVDLIAILRPTESVSLYQQIVGRGLRLSDGKQDCLILDYAGNTFDLYTPEIGETRPDPSSVVVDVPCPVCQFSNQFWGKTDDDGHVIEHYGRRCQGLVKSSDQPEQQEQQCDYRFRFKECDQCGAENDIAARICQQCQHTLVDPDKKLRELLKLKDAHVLRCNSMQFESGEDKQGRDRLKVSYFDDDGSQLSEFFLFDSPAQRGAFWFHFCRKHLLNREPRRQFATSQQVIEQQNAFRQPDFVVARREGRFWKIKEKIFDYQQQGGKRHWLAPAD